jgi:hypothetical protein
MEIKMQKKTKDVLTRVTAVLVALTLAGGLISSTVSYGKEKATEFVDERIEKVVGRELKFISYMVEQVVGPAVVDSARNQLRNFIGEEDDSE